MNNSKNKNEILTPHDGYFSIKSKNSLNLQSVYDAWFNEKDITYKNVLGAIISAALAGVKDNQSTLEVPNIRFIGENWAIDGSGTIQLNPYGLIGSKDQKILLDLRGYNIQALALDENINSDVNGILKILYELGKRRVSSSPLQGVDTLYQVNKVKDKEVEINGIKYGEIPPLMIGDSISSYIKSVLSRLKF